MALTPRLRAVVASIVHSDGVLWSSKNQNEKVSAVRAELPPGTKATDSEIKSAFPLGENWKKQSNRSWDKTKKIVEACGCNFDDRKALPWDPKARRCDVLEDLVRNTTLSGRIPLLEVESYVRNLNHGDRKKLGQIDRKMTGHLLVWADAIGAISWQPGWEWVHRGTHTDDKFFSADDNPDVSGKLNAASYGHVVKAVVHRTGNTLVDLEQTKLGAFQSGLADTPEDVKKLAKQAAKYWGWKIDGDVIDTQPAVKGTPTLSPDALAPDAFHASFEKKLARAYKGSMKSQREAEKKDRTRRPSYETSIWVMRFFVADPKGNDPKKGMRSTEVAAFNRGMAQLVADGKYVLLPEGEKGEWAPVMEYERKAGIDQGGQRMIYVSSAADQKQAPARKADKVKQPALAEAEDMGKAKKGKTATKKSPAKKATAKKATAKKATAKKAAPKKAKKATTTKAKPAKAKPAKAKAKAKPAKAKPAKAKKATAKKSAPKKAAKKAAPKKAAKKAAPKKAAKKAAPKKAAKKSAHKKAAKKAAPKKAAKKAAPKKAAPKKAPKKAKKAAPKKKTTGVAVVSVPSLTGARGAPLVQPELPMIEVERAPAKKKPKKAAAKAKTPKATKPKKAAPKKATKKAPAKKAPAGKARAGTSARAKTPEEKKKMPAPKKTKPAKKTEAAEKKPMSKTMKIRQATARLAKLTAPASRAPAKENRGKAAVSQGRYTGPRGQKVSIKRVWSNPVMNTTSMVIALSATAVGYGVADMLDRWIATRPDSDKKDAKPLYGLPAAAAIRTKPDGTRIAAQLGFSAVMGAGAYYTNDKYPYVSFGLGGLAVGAGIKFVELFMKGTLLPALFKAKKANEESYSNRYYADLQDWAQKGTVPAGGNGTAAGFLGTPPFPSRSPRAQAVGPVATGTVGCGCGAKGGSNAYDLSKLFPGSGGCSNEDKSCNDGPAGFCIDPNGGAPGVVPGGGGTPVTPGGSTPLPVTPGPDGRLPIQPGFTPPSVQPGFTPSRIQPGGYQPPRDLQPGGGGRPDGVDVPPPFTPPGIQPAYQPPRNLQPNGTANLMLRFHRTDTPGNVY